MDGHTPAPVLVFSVGGPNKFLESQMWSWVPGRVSGLHIGIVESGVAWSPPRIFPFHSVPVRVGSFPRRPVLPCLGLAALPLVYYIRGKQMSDLSACARSTLPRR